MRFFLLCALAALTAAAAPPPTSTLVLSFDSVFGNNMLLQQAPAAAAVYGFLDYASSMGNAEVTVTLTPEGGAPATFIAKLNTTVQTFGPDWGVRPCPSCPDIDPPFNPFHSPLASWKVLLPPTPAGLTAAAAPPPT